MSDPVLFLVSDARVTADDLRVMNSYAAAVRRRLPAVVLLEALRQRGIDVAPPDSPEAA